MFTRWVSRFRRVPAGIEVVEADGSVDTFAGRIQVKWVPGAGGEQLGACYSYSNRTGFAASTRTKLLAELKVSALIRAPGSAEAASEHVLLLLPLLRLVRRQRTDLAQRMQGLLDEMAKPGPTNGQYRIILD